MDINELHINAPLGEDEMFLTVGEWIESQNIFTNHKLESVIFRFVKIAKETI